MSKSHHSNADVAAMLAKSGWGKQFETQEDAQQAMMKNPGEVAAWGIIELLRRLNALGDTGRTKQSQATVIAKPGNAKAFPEKKPGDFLYSGDLDDGFHRWIVVSADSDGFVVVTECDQTIGSDVWGCGLTVGVDWHFASEREVVMDSAKTNIEYHAPKLRLAEKALAACESGGDLSEFMQPDDE